MSGRGNPWSVGDINEVIVKAAKLGLTPLVKAYETVREILQIVEAIEREDARRLREREAARKFFSGGNP
jgi:hypothetical protein